MTTTRDRTAANRATPRTGEAREQVLVDAAWLAAHLDDPHVRVVEVDVSATAYAEWHVDGAVLWNVYADLKDADYRLVDGDALESLLARSGIEPDSTVIFYGYAAAMGVWLLRLLGHADARVLDCSRDTWRAEGHPWSTAAADPAHSAYRLGPVDGRVRADHAAVRDAIGRPDVRLLDVRSPEEFRGERFWPSGAVQPDGRAGHVPSAVRQTIDGIQDERGAFRPAHELRTLFAAADLDGDSELITYCAVGGRAATAWFVLTELLGRDHVRVYDGSWAEWGRMPGTAVAAP